MHCEMLIFGHQQEMSRNDYDIFFYLQNEMLEFLTKTTGRDLHLWDVEHAFWFHMQEKSPTPPTHEKKGGTVSVVTDELPEDFIPPVISILPKLAINDPEV